MMDWQRIYLLPMGMDDSHLMKVITKGVEKAFDIPAHTLGTVAVPKDAYDSSRNQYKSTDILKLLYTYLPPDALRLLAVTNVDLYVPQFNYVFGQAAVDGKVGIISIYRLYPEFYGEPKNPKLFEARVVKEAVHELGHTFGLHHCDDPKCVMHFSTNIKDTDRKSAEFCEEDAKRLRQKIQSMAKAA